MTNRNLARAFVLSAALATSALTAPAHAAADQLEAVRLQKLFQTFTGNVPNSITVSPNGDIYDVTVNFAAWLEKAGLAQGSKVQVDPLQLSLVKGAEGQWDVLASGPWHAYLDAPNGSVVDVTVGNLEMIGSYDQKLLGFKNSSLTLSNLIVASTYRESFPARNVSATVGIDRITSKGTSAEAGGGFVNSKGHFQLDGIIGSFTSNYADPATAPNPPEDVNFVINNVMVASEVTAMNVRPVIEMTDWLAANQANLNSPALLVEARQKMLALLPVFANIKTTYSTEGMRVNTPFGPASVGTLGLSLDMNGVMKEGKYAQGFSYSGLKLPPKAPLPGWIAPLVPTKFDMLAEATDFDLETPSIKFLSEFDANAASPIPAGAEAQYIQAAVPNGTVKVIIPPSELVSELYRITFTANSDVPVTGAPPAVTAQITMAGIEDVVKHLQQAAGADPMAQQSLAALFAFKGIGRLEEGITKWDVVFGADGKLLVNGTDVTTMMANLK